MENQHNQQQPTQQPQYIHQLNMHGSNLQTNNSFSNQHNNNANSNNTANLNFHNHPILPSSIQDTFNTLPIQTQHQIINQILATSSDANKVNFNNPNQLPLPSLPLAPPPSLASALYAQQQYQQQQHQQQQQQQLLDDLIQNTIARGPQQPSPVQYNSPWNVNLETNHAATSNNLLNSAFIHRQVINLVYISQKAYLQIVAAKFKKNRNS